MNCEKCQELLSDFLDGTLVDEDQKLFNTHLEECLPCADVREDLSAILSVAREYRGEYAAPPNERALWLRISNTIESELRGAARARSSAAEPVAALSSPRGFWPRLLEKRWELSLPQLAGAVAAIIVSVSLVTALSIQSLRAPGPASAPAPIGINDPSATTRITYDDYVERQQLAIEYWKQRIEMRKAHWNPRMRDAYERSLSGIDQVVNQSLQELRANPHDQVSEEMLNAALRDKMELLREFSEL